MNDEQSENISDGEVFYNVFHYFYKSLEILSLEAKDQCTSLNNYNVAWEIKDDISRGETLLRLNGGRLAEDQKAEIAILLFKVRKIPTSVLTSANNVVDNLKAMSHPCWVPLRAEALRLLALLDGIDKQN